MIGPDASSAKSRESAPLQEAISTRSPFALTKSDPVSLESARGRSGCRKQKALRSGASGSLLSFSAPSSEAD